MILLSACTGQSKCVEPPIVQPTQNPVLPTLISPASGSTGNSTGPLDVAIGSAIGVVSLFVTDGSGNVIMAANLRPSNASSNDVRIGTFAQLASRTTYQVYATALGSGPTMFQCSPNAFNIRSQIVLLGTFTTG